VSLNVTIDIGGELKESLEDFREGLLDASGLNARIAAESERWIKGPQVAGKISAEQHRTANNLGATPTGHLAEAYEGIEGQYDDKAATLTIPGASRLRAAFGPYVLVPKKPNGFLSLPAQREAYGRRAREFDDLFILKTAAGRTDNRKALFLARAKGKGIEVMYVLVKSAEIPEDKTLIPFDELEEVAAIAAGEYIDSEIEKTLSN